MESETVHVREVPMEDPKRLVLVSGPQPGCPVMAAGGKVVTIGGKGTVPHREHVTLHNLDLRDSHKNLKK